MVKLKTYAYFNIFDDFIIMRTDHESYHLWKFSIRNQTKTSVQLMWTVSMKHSTHYLLS